MSVTVPSLSNRDETAILTRIYKNYFFNFPFTFTPTKYGMKFQTRQKIIHSLPVSPSTITSPFARQFSGKNMKKLQNSSPYPPTPNLVLLLQIKFPKNKKKPGQTIRAVFKPHHIFSPPRLVTYSHCTTGKLCSIVLFGLHSFDSHIVQKSGWNSSSSCLYDISRISSSVV